MDRSGIKNSFIHKDKEINKNYQKKCVNNSGYIHAIFY